MTPPSFHEDERLRQLMDACRPGSDDLALPEMRDLAVALRSDPILRSEWEVRQRGDRAVSAAMHDVSVPLGLAQRILAAAAACDQQPLARAVNAATVVEAPSEVELQPALPADATNATRIPYSRRRILQYLAAAALLFAAAVWGWQWMLPPAKVSQGDLEAIAQSWFETALPPAGSAQPVSTAAIPFPSQAVAVAPVSWRTLVTAEEPSVVVFDLTRPQFGGRAFLFAARTRKEYDVASVPYTPLNATRGLAMGAWQQGDVLYVLVVDTERGRLRLDDFLRSPELAMGSSLRR